MGRSVLEVVDRSLRDLDIDRDEPMVVAVSGGLDSVALLHWLVELGQRTVVATIDHGLRPSSRADAEWVAELARSLALDVELRSVVVGEGNTQAQARLARYTALADVARSYCARFVATGHTATDQAETVLMAMTRGAGLRGLAGMAPSRALEDGIHLIRPLLQTSGSSLEAVVHAKGWEHRSDPSNATDAYQRNRLRRSVLPGLREEGGAHTDLRIAASAASARVALEALRQGFDRAFDGTVLVLEDEISDGHLAVWVADVIAAVAPDVIRTQPLIHRVLELADAEIGQRVESSGLIVWRERGGLRFERASQVPVLEGGLVVKRLNVVPSSFSPDPAIEVVDADRVRDLEVRLWRDGDRIRPIGLDGTQLVSDILRDRGVPRALRGRVPVVCIEDEVMWVVGHRLAQSVAISSETKHAERWTWSLPAG